jgi:hypothetical protein
VCNGDADKDSQFGASRKSEDGWKPEVEDDWGDLEEYNSQQRQWREIIERENAENPRCQSSVNSLASKSTAVVGVRSFTISELEEFKKEEAERRRWREWYNKPMWEKYPASAIDMYEKPIAEDYSMIVNSGIAPTERELTAPFGFTVVFEEDSCTTNWVVHREEAKMVQFAYHKFLDEGWSYRKIADSINAEGFKTREGKDFDEEAIIEMLSDPHYKMLLRCESYFRFIDDLVFYHTQTLIERRKSDPKSMWEKSPVSAIDMYEKPITNDYSMMVKFGIEPTESELTAPFGFTVVFRKETYVTNWVVHREEAKIVQFAYHKFLDEGFSYRKIADSINAKGFKTREGKDFDEEAIIEILSDSHYKMLLRCESYFCLVDHLVFYHTQTLIERRKSDPDYRFPT